MLHETKNTLEVTRWCNVCRKFAQHACSGKKPGHCLEHERTGMSKKQEATQKKREEEEQNPRLL